MKNYKQFGVMLDMSRNAVMKVSQVKKFMNIIKSFGYNALGLYLEDTYEIKGEPYFGYLRGRYTQAELKEIDAYGQSIGVQVIPYIQTLAHLDALTRNMAYNDVFDIEDVLLIDEPKTYDLIDKMFQTVSDCFTSRTVNIGMDEAFKVGLGKYINKHGYQN
ncbi:MAG: family 20 glycosylhydrolase, partial [Clostridia bacterium]|nr:family 20 glycosylhydrolase [Clostridia bacterium]